MSKSKYIDAEAFKRRILSYGIVHEGDRIPIPFYKHYFAEACVAILRWVCEEVDDTPAANVSPRWIPVKMRPMDSEEREYWEEHTGFTLTEDMAQTFNCPMPDDGQRIWVQTKNGFVFDDVCDSDCDGIGLEGNGDWDDIIAWMPMNVPEPWKGEDNG